MLKRAYVPVTEETHDPSSENNTCQMTRTPQIYIVYTSTATSVSLTENRDKQKPACIDERQVVIHTTMIIRTIAANSHYSLKKQRCEGLAMIGKTSLNIEGSEST
jgi:hypothetical protein